MAPTDPTNPYAPPKARTDAPEREAPRAVVERRGDEWVTVASFGSSPKAIQALRTLEDAKLECRVLADGSSESAVSFHWSVRSVPLGGHRVQVRRADLAEAAKLLGVEVDEPEETEEPNLADDRMKKALFFALLGAIVCPGPAHVLSMLFIVGTPKSDMTEVGLRRRRWALIVDLAMFAAIAFIVATSR